MGLWAAPANFLGKNGLMAVGQERMGSPLEIKSQRLSVGIAWVRKKPCCLESED